MCHTPVGSQGQHAVHVSNGCGVFKLLKISMAIPENVSYAMIERVRITEMQGSCEKKTAALVMGYRRSNRCRQDSHINNHDSM